MKQTVTAVREKLRLWGLTEQQISDIEKSGQPSDHVTIFAPISGVVIHKNATEGIYVKTGSKIYTIADLTRVWIMLDAYESDLMWLRYGQDVEFETEAYPGDVFQGRIAFIDPVLDKKTRTVKVRVNVDNKDGRLKPDMFVRSIVRAKVAAGGKVMDTSLAGKWICPMHPEVVKDKTGSCDVCGMPLVKAEKLGYVSLDDAIAKASLVIPVSAPLITGKRAVVYVEEPGKEGTYQGRDIVLGPRAGDFYLVKEGLNEGEMVVVNGNFKIDSAIQILAKPSMMNPDKSVVEHHDHENADRPDDSLTSVPLAGDLNPRLMDQIESIYAAYFDLQFAFSHDDFDKSKTAADALIKSIGKVSMKDMDTSIHEAYMPHHSVIKKSAGAIGSTVDMTAARKHFEPLSSAIIAVA
ncbi:MAG: HlyD family efflux transporter periplasmic adaptor subunit, partial [Planctomycetes bacterium]|nr:HlyD family efflux transporter periplasmic adaptor subunit [Planctomycetota bacterium]